MKRCPRSLSLAASGLALVVAIPAAAGGGATLPAPLAAFTAEYRVTNGSIDLGNTTIELQPRSGGWLYRSVTEASGLLSLFVRGRAIDATHLVPHEGWLRPVRYRHEEPDADDNVTVDFDWTTCTATATHAKGMREVALEPATVDGFSATLELVRALAAGRDQLEIPTIDDEGEPETLVFRRAGRERIEVPFGTFEAVRVERQRRDSDRETITWLVPALSWVALRIDQRDDGELEGRLLLTQLDGDAADRLETARTD